MVSNVFLAFLKVDAASSSAPAPKETLRVLEGSALLTTLSASAHGSASSCQGSAKSSPHAASEEVAAEAACTVSLHGSKSGSLQGFFGLLLRRHFVMLPCGVFGISWPNNASPCRKVSSTAKVYAAKCLNNTSPCCKVSSATQVYAATCLQQHKPMLQSVLIWAILAQT